MLTAFSNDEDSAAVAGRQVHDEVIKQLEDEEMLKGHINNDDIVAIRLQRIGNSGSVDKSLETGNGNKSTAGAWNDTTRKATISVFSILACSVVAIAAVGIYRKTSAKDNTKSGGSIDSSCDGSIVTGDHSSDSGTPAEDQFHGGLFSPNDWDDEC